MSQRLYVACSRQVAARKLGDEMMIMSSRDSTLFTLDEVATRIWESADGSALLDEIVERRICTEFDVEPAEALCDAEELVEKLAQHGILIVSREPIVSSSPSLVFSSNPSFGDAK
jgi:coenzyme PQQ synthesis protein D (PqqD)